MTTLRRAYLICGTPRSGTTLLAGLLAGTGVAGRAREFFGEANEPSWSHARFGDYVRECVRLHASPNGVFGAKVLWGDLPRLVDRLRSGLDEPSEPDGALLARVFPGVRYLWLRRADRVGQAVSWWKAHQTREFFAGDERRTGVEPIFDFDEVHRLVRELEAGDAGWGRWFSENGIEPLPVLYEDLAHDPMGTGLRALAFLGVDLPAGASPIVRTTRQADELNADWIRRYREIAARQRYVSRQPRCGSERSKVFSQRSPRDR